MDEEKEDALVRKITTEAHSIPVNSKSYDIVGDFTLFQNSYQMVKLHKNH